MKMNFSKWSLVYTAALGLGLGACQNEDKVDPEIPSAEYQYVRVLISDEVSNDLTLINPSNGETAIFTSKFPKAAMYGTDAGRYAALVHTQNNYVEFFDSGLENHGDHMDTKGTAKFAALTGESAKPTHFKSKGNEVITFNDGDGSMSVADEADFHVVGAKMSKLETGNSAHHGAMAPFDNGTYAVTEKDGSVTGTLPERVKIIDKNGSVRYSSTLATGGIHGNAGNGEYAVFGSSSGILVVHQQGEQKLIAYPQQFGTQWLGTIMYAKKVKRFLGYSAALGLFDIDIESNKINTILESKEIVQAKVDYSGSSLVVLQYDGSIKVIDLNTNTVAMSGSPLTTIDKEQTQKPQLEATARYIYITQPQSGELWQVDRKDLKVVKKHKVTATPYRLALLGGETDAGH
ncbi:hypothetical protein [Dyadobacter tibetensis]|uniref:hypothetical protein n=1 Tax=Dyadobacter tibetensis TaxID=1211851 RepID=UPI0004707C08|nr:hypothetical protein [Dyadobacter tibetensis]